MPSKGLSALTLYNILILRTQEKRTLTQEDAEAIQFSLTFFQVD